MITDPESVLPHAALLYVRDAAAFTECKNPAGATYKETFDRPEFSGSFPVVGYEVPWSFVDRYYHRVTNWGETYDEITRRWFEERGKVLRELHHEPLIFQFIGGSGSSSSYTVFDLLYLNINARVYSVWRYDTLDSKSSRDKEEGSHFVFAWDTPTARQVLTAMRLLT